MGYQQPVFPFPAVVRDFFGRVVTKASSSSGKPQTRNDVWFKYKEGYSNAVRKPIKISTLKRLQALPLPAPSTASRRDRCPPTPGCHWRRRGLRHPSTPPSNGITADGTICINFFAGFCFTRLRTGLRIKRRDRL
ncbi:hypothetical protein TcasGA2_TC006508 [Tribolium castaneum]|uniref:Uncharacterized protein n=1 Tax=Tribolium castaneum TaxID=7070 RepID=D6WXA5_TRICA|nr:hypothetical protein TcasGA2_TC006508 [Tribolium castaneum]